MVFQDVVRTGGRYGLKLSSGTAFLQGRACGACWFSPG
jgi:hypothetical protein